MKQDPYWRHAVLQWPVNLTSNCPLVPWRCVLKHIFIREGKTAQTVAENIRRYIYLSINQLDAQNLFHIKFYFMPVHVSSTCAHHQEVKIVLHSLWYHHTYRWPSRARDRGSTVVKVLCYNSEGRWFDRSWCQWNFHWHKILLIALWP